MENYKFFKIREANGANLYELWDSLSGSLYGIDETTKKIITSNSNYINNSEQLKNMLDFLSNNINIYINNDYVVEQGQDGVIIVNKTNDYQFVANNIVFDIIQVVNNYHYLSQVLDEMSKIYNIKEDENIDIINCMIQLIGNNILYIS